MADGTVSGLVKGEQLRREMMEMQKEAEHRR